MALEEYWERGRGTGEAGLPLVVLVRIAVEGCGDASLIRKRSGNSWCDWRGEWSKGSGKACLCSREGRLPSLHSTKSTHLHCLHERG